MENEFMNYSYIRNVLERDGIIKNSGYLDFKSEYNYSGFSDQSKQTDGNNYDIVDDYVPVAQNERSEINNIIDENVNEGQINVPISKQQKIASKKSIDNDSKKPDCLNQYDRTNSFISWR